MAETWMVIFLVVGIILLAIGLIGGYAAYIMSAFDFFPAWMFLAFIGFILTLIGVAMGVKERSGNEQ